MICETEEATAQETLPERTGQTHPIKPIRNQNRSSLKNRRPWRRYPGHLSLSRLRQGSLTFSKDTEAATGRTKTREVSPPRFDRVSYQVRGRLGVAMRKQSKAAWHPTLPVS